MNTTMHAAVVTAFGQPLALHELNTATPGPGQVLVKTDACGVCHIDVHAANSDSPLKPGLPFIPGHEGIGIVVALGAGVTACGLMFHCPKSTAKPPMTHTPRPHDV